MKKILLVLVLLFGAAPALAVNMSVKLGNANYTVGPSDNLIVTQQAFTAPRTLTLPYAGSTVISNSNLLTILDAAQTVTVSNTLTIAPQAGDTINGSPSPVVVNYTGAKIVLYPLTGTNWFLVQQTASGGSSQALTGDVTAPAGTGITTYNNVVPVAKGGTGNAGGAWTTYTPTVASSGGTITTVAAAAGSYQAVGKLVNAQVYFSITTNGTGSGFIDVGLPPGLTPFRASSCTAADDFAITALTCVMGASGTTARLATATGTYPGADSHGYRITFMYQSN